ncbi:arsenate reductase (glutaredoxin) [Robertkochia sediminum]|uniref:arsenate reductase (glutaredoxin) n=1 Tax=Robertkochia sediminum TaxID=2785326 RepID=UPI00193316D2|nr:arsenate reductase (glutaredoxin) [Robertkochia sediminum]MBL7473432.1 arsenate reductase (glutaredoxin) [Robertkochia sediminum]
MLKIYHNPRCSKSRQGLQILEASGQEFEVVKYLDNPLSEGDLKTLLGYLNIKPEALIRKNEKIWKEEFKGKDLSDEDLIKAMAEHPKLIERPIVVKDHKAVVGRPPEAIEAIL